MKKKLTKSTKKPVTMKNNTLIIKVSFILVSLCFLFLFSAGTALALDVSSFSPVTGTYQSDSDMDIDVFIDAPAGNTVLCDFRTNESGTMTIRDDDVSVTPQTTAEFSSTGLSDGLYEWSINCTDTTASSDAQTGINTLTIDTTQPNVTLASPSDGAIIESTNTVTFSGTATDANPDACTLYTTYNGTMQPEAVPNAGSYESYQFTLSDLSDKTFDWDVKCTDLAGNQAFASSSATVEVDYVNDAPIIGLDTPQYVGNGVSYSRSIDADDPNPSDVLTYASSSSNFTIDASGMITNTNPTHSENVTFNVCDDSGASNNCTSTVIQFIVREPLHQLNITEPNFGNVLERLTNHTRTFTIENTGDFTQDAIKVKTTAKDKYNINITNVPASLDPGESATATISLTVPDDIDSGRLEIGFIYVESDSVVYETNPLELDVANELAVSDFDITGKNIETYRDLEQNNEDIVVHPGDEVDFSFVVENTYTDEEDIRFDTVDITLTIEHFANLDGDDLEYEFSTFKLDPEDDRTLEYTLTVPYNIEDGTDYPAELEIIAEDEEGNEHNYTWETDFVGSRDSDEIKIIEYELNDQDITCRGDSLESIGFNGLIMNMGDSAQENMYAELYIPELDLIQTYEFELTEDPDDDENSYRIDHVFELPDDTPSDRYYINLDAYSEFNDLEDKIALSFEVDECQDEETSPQPTQPPVTEPSQDTDNNDTDEDQDESDKQEKEEDTDEAVTDGLVLSETDERHILSLYDLVIPSENVTLTKQKTRSQNVTYTTENVESLLNLTGTLANTTRDELKSVVLSVKANETSFVPLNRTVTLYQLEVNDTIVDLTHVSYSFMSNTTLKDTQIIELIPKSYATNVTELFFSENEPIVLDSDPAIMWQIRNVKPNRSYQTEYLLVGDHFGFSSTAIATAETGAFFFWNYLAIAGIVFGALVLLGGLGFGTVVLVQRLVERSFEEPDEEDVSHSREYRNIYQKEAPMKRTIQLSGLPEIETEVDPHTGRIKSGLEL
jgi:hypothetical protein